VERGRAPVFTILQMPFPSANILWGPGRSAPARGRPGASHPIAADPVTACFTIICVKGPFAICARLEVSV